MELWELDARESIRDIVTRYNSNGDSGRFAELVELFAEDAVMETGGPFGNGAVYRGRTEIGSMFNQTKERWGKAAEERSAPAYVRHCVFTHQIDIIDRTHARGRSYFQVIMAHGLDHWGRYLDEYEQREGRWVFTHRKAMTDGRATGSVV